MFSVKKKALGLTVLALALLASSCQLVSFIPAKPSPGTVGFYDFNAPQSKIVTEDMKIARMSIPGDRVFVYRVNDDMIVLGAGNTNANAKIKPLDEVASGAVITPDAAKKLAAFLEKVIAQYNIKDKKISQYQDFRILTSGAAVATATEKDVAAPVETIVLRMQYVYNMVAIENAELTLCYFGDSGPTALKELKINEITTLITSLQKN